MAIDNTTGFLVEAPGVVVEIEDLGVGPAEDVGDVDERNTTSERRDFGRCAWVGIHDPKERVPPIQIDEIPAEAALRYPRAGGHHVLSANTILRVWNVAVGRSVHVEPGLERPRSHPRIRDGKVGAIPDGEIALCYNVVLGASTCTKASIPAAVWIDHAGRRYDRFGRHRERVEQDLRFAK